MKRYELRSLHNDGTAVLYNRLGGYYKEVRFLWYSKKDIYRKLRNEYDCMVTMEYFKRLKGV